MPRSCLPLYIKVLAMPIAPIASSLSASWTMHASSVFGLVPLFFVNETELIISTISSIALLSKSFST